MTLNHKSYLPISKECFICGEENPAGLKSRFYVEDGLVKLPLNVSPDFSGYRGIIHGGILAAAMDECMGWAAARAIQRMCVTGEMTVRYLKNAPIGQNLLVVAEVSRAHRRMVHTLARVEGPEGEIYTRAEGKFLPLSVDETLAVDDALIYRGDEERVFDCLR
jgi:acyl-coenzyme A thioesterase PaaI-like protein